MKFFAIVEKTITQKIKVQIDADSPEQARDFAQALADQCDYNGLTINPQRNLTKYPILEETTETKVQEIFQQNQTVCWKENGNILQGKIKYFNPTGTIMVKVKGKPELVCLDPMALKTSISQFQ